MSLTYELNNPDSPLRWFLDRELPNVKTVAASYRSQLSDTDVVRPAPPEGVRPDWTTIGAAIDHRLRYAFTENAFYCNSVAQGMLYAQKNHEDEQAAKAIAKIFVWDLGDALRDMQMEHRPADRSRHILLQPQAEERLDRLCYVMTWFEQVYRGGLQPGTTIGDATGNLTLERLLAAVPDYAIDDIANVVAHAEQPLAELRAATVPSACHNGPTFTGSTDVGAADADLIAGDLLLDVKATINPRRLAHADFYQLISYALLDYDDDYDIRRVGFYLARFGQLIMWDVGEYLAMLGCTDSLDEVRTRLAETLDARE